MPPVVFEWLDALVVAIALLSVAFLGYGLLEFRLSWHVRRSERAAVIDASGGGPIELEGVARPADGRTVRSPFTDTECLVCEYEVEEERHSRHGTSWSTVASGVESVPFLLEDNSGSVLVEPPGADLHLDVAARIRVDAGERPPAAIARFVEHDDRVDSQDGTIAIGPLEIATGDDARFTERRLDVGDTVHVLGTARFETSVGRAAGQVNAAVGVDRDALASGRLGWYRHLLFGWPFLISSGTRRDGARWIAVDGVQPTLIGLIGLWAVWAIAL